MKRITILLLLLIVFNSIYAQKVTKTEYIYIRPLVSCDITYREIDVNPIIDWNIGIVKYKIKEVDNQTSKVKLKFKETFIDNKYSCNDVDFYIIDSNNCVVSKLYVKYKKGIGILKFNIESNQKLAFCLDSGKIFLFEIE